MQLADETGTTTEIGTEDVRALTDPQANHESIRLTAPSTPGTYRYWACVDSVAGESDTTNNCSGKATVTLTNNLATEAATEAPATETPATEKAAAAPAPVEAPATEEAAAAPAPVEAPAITPPSAGDAGLAETSGSSWMLLVIAGALVSVMAAVGKGLPSFFRRQ